MSYLTLDRGRRGRRWLQWCWVRSHSGLGDRTRDWVIALVIGQVITSIVNLDMVW